MFRKNLGIWIGLAITINGFVFLSIQNFRGSNPSTETNFGEQLQSVQRSSESFLKRKNPFPNFHSTCPSVKKRNLNFQPRRN